MVKNIAEFTDETFQTEVLECDTPVVVDFWAEWCAPCRAMTPIIEQLAGQVGDNAKVGKLNVDHAQKTATNYGISAIPTILIFNGGEVQKKLVGVTSLDDLKAAIDELG